MRKLCCQLLTTEYEMGVKSADRQILLGNKKLVTRCTIREMTVDLDTCLPTNDLAPLTYFITVMSKTSECRDVWLLIETDHLIEHSQCLFSVCNPPLTHVDH